MPKSNNLVVPCILGHETIFKANEPCCEIHTQREELFLIHYALFSHPYHVVGCPLFVLFYSLVFEIVALQEQRLIVESFDFEGLAIQHPGFIMKCRYNNCYMSIERLLQIRNRN